MNKHELMPGQRLRRPVAAAVTAVTVIAGVAGSAGVSAAAVNDAAVGGNAMSGAGAPGAARPGPRPLPRPVPHALAPHRAGRSPAYDGRRLTVNPNGTESQTFGFTGGSQSFTVPAGVTSVSVTAWGGSGGAGGASSGDVAPGGAGAQISATVPVSPGQALPLLVGGAGGSGAANTITGGVGGSGSGDGMDGGPGGNGAASPATSSGGGGGAGTQVLATSGGQNVLVMAAAGGGGGGAGGDAVGSAGAGGPGGAAGTKGNGGNGAGIDPGIGGAYASAPSTTGTAGQSSTSGAAGGGGGGQFLGGAGGGQAGDTYSGGGGGGSGASFTGSLAGNPVLTNGPAGNGGVTITWTPPPSVTQVSPEDGIPAGGQTVTITGSSFTGATAVHFGTKAAAKFTVVSDTEITAVPPAGSGRVNVTVTSPQTTSATSAADAYTYLGNGSLLGWGSDEYGELGNGQGLNFYDLPVAVDLPSGTTAAAAMGAYTGYTLTGSGTVLAWGYGGDGELGDGTTNGSTTPVAVQLPAGTTVTAIAGGTYAGYALTSAGAVYAWGDNTYGELGNGSTADSDVPVKVKLPAGTTVTALAAGEYMAYARTAAGTELAWGSNNSGELGNGTTTSSSTPVPVTLPAGTSVTAVAAGYLSGYALTSSGSVLAWGYGGDGELGNGTDNGNALTPVTVKLPAGTKVAQIGGEYTAGLARTTTGSLLAWGSNAYDNLGDGGTAPSDVPVPVALPAGVTASSTGPSHDDAGLAVVSVLPTVTKLSPATGAAGTKVTITGLDLQGATAVHFGSAAATFTVTSPTSITATAPAGKGKVTVTVTTPLGTSANVKAASYTY